jgi:cobalamin synthase
MEDPNAGARRFLAGLIAVLLLTAAALLWVLPGVSTNQAALMWRAACGRIGVVMVALWMALPTRTRPAAWANLNPRSVSAVVLAALAIRFPLRFLVPVAAILVVAGAFLRPRERFRPPREAEVDRH